MRKVVEVYCAEEGGNGERVVSWEVGKGGRAVSWKGGKGGTIVRRQ